MRVSCWINWRSPCSSRGLGFLSYLYGVASARFELFPYEVVQDALSAAKALREAWA